MGDLKQGLRYAQYKLKAKDEHSIHSPFVFELYTDIIHSGHQFYAFDPIEALRDKLLESEEVLMVTDLGAGSKHQHSDERKVADVVKHASTDQQFGQLLFRLVHYFKPNTILELGTSLGLGTAYLAAPCKSTRVVTVEGCPETAALAKVNLESLQLGHVDIRVGEFGELLPAILSELNQLDMAYLDGNHRKKPTLDYFDQCLEKAHNESVFILDDIHWSAEMQEAWEEIKKHPKVRVTIDLFYKGLVFLREEQEKEHFVLRY